MGRVIWSKGIFVFKELFKIDIIKSLYLKNTSKLKFIKIDEINAGLALKVPYFYLLLKHVCNQQYMKIS